MKKELTVSRRLNRTLPVPTMDKYEPVSTRTALFPHLPVLQAAGSDTFTAIAILVVAIGLAGLAILILFSKKKI
jgi:hypothetical protein